MTGKVSGKKLSSGLFVTLIGRKDPHDNGSFSPNNDEGGGRSTQSRSPLAADVFDSACRIFGGEFFRWSKGSLHHLLLSSLLRPALPNERRTHHPADDRDWSWRAPDLSIMMSKLCSYMSTGCSVKWRIKPSTAPPSGRAACWKSTERSKRRSRCGKQVPRDEWRRRESPGSSTPGTTVHRRLLIWPFLIFSSLNAREPLINFHFNLSGTLSQLTVVLITVVFGRRERCSPTCLCRLEVLQKRHKAAEGAPAGSIRASPRPHFLSRAHRCHAASPPPRHFVVKHPASQYLI